MTHQQGAPESQTLGALVHQLSQQIPDLVRSEIRLAQAEVTEKGKRAGIGIGMFSVAGLLGFFALATLVTTTILGLATVLDAWLAALLVAVILLVAAGVAGLVGKNKVAAAAPATPEKAIQGLKDDLTTVKEAAMSDTRTPEQIEAEIALQREQVASTVDELAAKLDVKSRAKAKAASLKNSATIDAGTPRPEVLAAAGSLAAMAVVLLLWRHRHTH